MKITILVGLPGSGKTTMASKLNGKILDDLSVNGGLDALRACAEEPEIIVVDPWLCLKASRDVAELVLAEVFPNHEKVWIYFENDPEACRKNIVTRDDGREVDGLIGILTKSYSVPKGLFAHPVWRPDPYMYQG